MHDPYLRIASATRPYLLQIGFILTDLPAKDLDRLRECVRTEERKRGEILFRQGAYPKGAFWVISGKVKIFQLTHNGIQQTLYVYTNGDLAGYRQIVTEEVYAVTAVLLEDSTIGFISNEHFRGLLDSSPFFTRNVLNALAREFTVWMNRMTALVQFPVRLRLVLALLTLHEQYRLSGSPPGVITMTRTELAEYVGTSLETVVRALNTLKSAGLVDVNGRRIWLPSPFSLVDILEEEEP
jgi:CRP-like cAMP-binding protein